MVWALLLALFLVSGERKEHKILRNVNVKELVGEKGCPRCHDMRRPLVGPPFYKISERYTEKDIDKLVESMLKGSRGKWTTKYFMPPQALSEEEAYTIAHWIINLKKKK